MPKKRTIAEELIAGFTELADALEANDDLAVRFNCTRMKSDSASETDEEVSTPTPAPGWDAAN